MFTKAKFSLVIVALCLAIPFTAQANKPIKGEWSGFFEEELIFDCDDYWILTNEFVEISWIYFFDQDGNWIREFFTITAVDDLYREGKPIHVSGSARVTAQAHYEDGEWLWEQRQGLFYKVTVPGYGDLVVETGRIMRDEDGFFFETPHSGSDYGPLCDYLRQE